MDNYTKLVELFRRTVRMVSKRGYDVSAYADLPDANGEYFYNKFVDPQGLSQSKANNPVLKFLEAEKSQDLTPREYLSQIFVKADPSAADKIKYCVVIYSPIPTTRDVPTAEVGVFLRIMNTFIEDNKSHSFEGIYITPTAVSSDASKSFNVNVDFMDIQHFLDSEVLFDPTEHNYCPRHDILTEAEKKELIESNKNIKLMYTFRIYTNEPVAKYLGAKDGDVIRIMAVTLIPECLVEEDLLHRLVRRPIEKKRKSRTKR
jgi:DNA-directed RNA polymerase subunit H (RpoH/RPB5)